MSVCNESSLVYSVLYLSSDNVTYSANRDSIYSGDCSGERRLWLLEPAMVEVVCMRATPCNNIESTTHMQAASGRAYGNCSKCQALRWPVQSFTSGFLVPFAQCSCTHVITVLEWWSLAWYVYAIRMHVRLHHSNTVIMWVITVCNV